MIGGTDDRRESAGCQAPDEGRRAEASGPAGDRGHRPPALAGRTTLLRAILLKRVLIMLRYPVNTLAQILGVYLFFALLFFGGRAAAGAAGAAGALGETFEALIVAWFLWTMSLTAYFGLSANVTREAQWGTLQQLFMSPYGFGTVMAATVLVLLAESLFWGGSILALMLLTTERTLSVHLPTVLPVSVLALAPVTGIGFVFAGAALLYKRIENVSQLVQFALIGLIAAPATGYGPLRLLPLVQGSDMLQRAMRGGVRLWEFPAVDLAILVGTAAVYLLAGYYVFVLATRRARRTGVMGHY